MLASRSKGSRGFTLIELLAVIAIIGMLFTLVAVNVTGILGGAKGDITKTKIKQLEEALRLYQMKHSAYPRTDQGLAILVEEKILEDKNLRDGWNHDFQYYFPGLTDPRKYDVISAGPDGQYGSEDDISNHTIDAEAKAEGNP